MRRAVRRSDSSRTRASVFIVMPIELPHDLAGRRVAPRRKGGRTLLHCRAP